MTKSSLLIPGKLYKVYYLFGEDHKAEEVLFLEPIIRYSKLVKIPVDSVVMFVGHRTHLDDLNFTQRIGEVLYRSQKFYVILDSYRQIFERIQ